VLTHGPPTTIMFLVMLSASSSRTANPTANGLTLSAVTAPAEPPTTQIQWSYEHIGICSSAGTAFNDLLVSVFPCSSSVTPAVVVSYQICHSYTGCLFISSSSSPNGKTTVVQHLFRRLFQRMLFVR
jgi:hypothetical protein